MLSRVHKNAVIEIIYMDRSGRFSQRSIKVLATTDHYVKAYCYTARQIRVFLLTNILGMRLIRRGKAS